MRTFPESRNYGQWRSAGPEIREVRHRYHLESGRPILENKAVSRPTHDACHGIGTRPFLNAPLNLLGQRPCDRNHMILTDDGR